MKREELQADATEEGFHLPRGGLLALFPLCTDRSEDLQTLRLGCPAWHEYLARMLVVFEDL